MNYSWEREMFSKHKQDWPWVSDNRQSKFLKVALYTEGSTIYKPTSQYGDLNIL